ncbi:hypothetical protein ABZP36_014200 [Zizania latifolia]
MHAAEEITRKGHEGAPLGFPGRQRCRLHHRRRPQPDPPAPPTPRSAAAAPTQVRRRLAPSSFRPIHPICRFCVVPSSRRLASPRRPAQRRHALPGLYLLVDLGGPVSRPLSRVSKFMLYNAAVKCATVTPGSIP